METYVWKDKITEALRWLGDYNYQAQALSNPASPYVWIPVENDLAIIDDSGLQKALDANQPVFGKLADQALRELRIILDKIDYNLPSNIIIDLPEMQLAREKANEVLGYIRLGM